MNALRNPGRVAGLWYLSVIVFGIFAEVVRSMVAPSEANTTLLRLGLLADVVMSVSMLLVGLTFFRLFRPVSENWSGLLAAFVVLGVAVNMAGLAQYQLALDHLAQPGAHAASLEAYRATYDLANVFFGLWLFPAGVLMAHSNFLPRWLGGVALAASVAFLAGSVVKFVVPGFYPLANPFLSVVMVAGEFLVTGWLVVRGSRTVS